MTEGLSNRVHALRVFFRIMNFGFILVNSNNKNSSFFPSHAAVGGYRTRPVNVEKGVHYFNINHHSGHPGVNTMAGGRRSTNGLITPKIIMMPPPTSLSHSNHQIAPSLSVAVHSSTRRRAGAAILLVPALCAIDFSLFQLRSSHDLMNSRALSVSTTEGCCSGGRNLRKLHMVSLALFCKICAWIDFVGR